MKKYAAKYSIVRFTPFLETEEFANVGVVVVVPELGQIDFKLNTQRYGRVTGFFSELDAGVYRETLKMLKAELLRVRGSLVRGGFEWKAGTSLVNEIFAELVRKRETIIQFSEPRVIACCSLEEVLESTYNHYVGRDFVTKEYVETKIEKGLRTVLRGARLAERFHADKVGDTKYQVRFPFVETGVTSGPAKLIKPLNLAHESSTQIIEHGDAWGAKLTRLMEKDFAVPERVLFVVAAPDANASSERQEAYQDSIERLRPLGSIALRADDANVLEFARPS